MEYKNISNVSKTGVTFEKCKFLKDAGDIKRGDLFDEVSVGVFDVSLELHFLFLFFLKLRTTQQVTVLEKVTDDNKKNKQNTVVYKIEFVSEDGEKRVELKINDLFFSFDDYITHGEDNGITLTDCKIERDDGPFEKGQTFEHMTIRIDLLKLICFPKTHGSCGKPQTFHIELKRAL